jgi:hypothetical protein
VWLEHATSLGLEVPKTVEKALEELRHLVMVFFGSCGANVINSEGLIVINGGLIILGFFLIRSLIAIIHHDQTLLAIDNAC